MSLACNPGHTLVQTTFLNVGFEIQLRRCVTNPAVKRTGLIWHLIGWERQRQSNYQASHYECIPRNENKKERENSRKSNHDCFWFWMWFLKTQLFRISMRALRKSLNFLVVNLKTGTHRCFEKLPWNLTEKSDLQCKENFPLVCNLQPRFQKYNLLFRNITYFYHFLVISKVVYFWVFNAELFLFQMRSSHMISHKAHLLVTEER